MNKSIPSLLTILLDGQHNFRDLGGVAAADGKVIRHGMLFRSGSLHAITQKDIAFLQEIRIRTIIDFRSERERQYHPNVMIPGVVTRQVVIRDEVREIAMVHLERNEEKELACLLANDYRRMINRNQAEFRMFLDEILLTSDLPLVFHCAAGKDRTGLAALFLMTALGVDFDQIFLDYLETNRRGSAYAAKFIAEMTKNGYNGELLRPLLEVRPEYLEAALDEMDQNYGGLETFVKDVLHADYKKLRERFLEVPK